MVNKLTYASKASTIARIIRYTKALFLTFFMNVLNVIVAFLQTRINGRGVSNTSTIVKQIQLFRMVIFIKSNVINVRRVTTFKVTKASKTLV